MEKKDYVYIIGMIVSFFAILFTNYWHYKKLTIEDFILSLLASIFSWGTAILIPILIAADEVKFLDKTIIKRKL